MNNIEYSLDELTKVYDRSYLDILSKEGIKEGNIVVSLDFDDTKVVNERYGYEVGNLVIKEVINCVKKYLAADDVIFRYDQRKFIMVLNELDDIQAFGKVDMIRKMIKKVRFFDSDSSYFLVTCSFGFFRASENMTFDDALSKANEALLVAKRNGKDQVVNAKYNFEEVISKIYKRRTTN